MSRISRLKSILVIGVFSIAMTGTSTSAQEYGSNTYLTDRLVRLESAVQDLQGVVYSVENSGYGAPAETYVTHDGSYDGDASVRIGRLELELQNLTGRIEEIAYKVDQNAARLESLTAVLSQTTSPQVYSDNPPVVSSPDTYTYDAPTSSGPTSLSGSAPLTADSGVSDPMIAESMDPDPAETCVAAVPADADGAYEFAFDALLNGDYPLAECVFRSFLTTYPDDRRAPDAQFRLGEIYLATGANVKAAKAFLNHVKTWPADPRAPESYLKLGTAYSRLGQRDQACQIFDVTRSKYPNASSNVRQRLAIERGAAGC